jgi:hypothetical protein
MSYFEILHMLLAAFRSAETQLTSSRHCSIAWRYDHCGLFNTHSTEKYFKYELYILMRYVGQRVTS